MYCGNCGTKMADDACFCPSCGTKMQEPFDRPVRKTPPAPVPPVRIPTGPARDPSAPFPPLSGPVLLLVFAIVSAMAIASVYMTWLEVNMTIMGARMNALSSLSSAFGMDLEDEILSLSGMYKIVKVADPDVAPFYLFVMLTAFLSLPLTWLFLAMRSRLLSAVSMVVAVIPMAFMLVAASYITDQGRGYLDGSVGPGFWLYLAAFAVALVFKILASRQIRAQKLL